MKSKFTALILMLILLLPSVFSIQNTNNDDVSLDTATDQFTDDQDITCILNGVSGPATDDYKFYWLVNGVRKDQGLADQTVLPASLSNVNDQVACMVVDFDFSVQGIEVVLIQPTLVNQPPVANAGDDRNVNVNELVNFDGSLSNDPDGTIASFNWNFGDGSSSNEAGPSHAYLQEGTFTVALTVTDDGGAQDTDTAVITVRQIQMPANNPPVVDLPDFLFTGRNSGALVLDLNLFVSDDSTPDNVMRWSVSGNTNVQVSIDLNNVAALTPSLDFSGSEVLTFTATDREGLQGSDSVEVVVFGIERLTNFRNRFLEETDSFFRNERIYSGFWVVTGTEGIPGIDPSQVSVNLEKNGNVLVNFIRYTGAAGPRNVLNGEECNRGVIDPFCTNDSPGLYYYVANSRIPLGDSVLGNADVVVRILGTSSSKAVQIFNNAPTLELGNDFAVQPGQLVDLNALGVVRDVEDADAVLVYAWDFNSDGIVDSNNAVTTTSFAVDGVYTITLAVTDSDGAQATDTLRVTVGNERPVANAGTDRTVALNELVNFDGSLSNDPDGTIISYEWDFGDGTTDSGVQVSHAYLQEGTFTVTLTVTDNLGVPNSDNAVITVSSDVAPNQPPVANAGDDKKTGVLMSVSLDGSLSNDIDGNIVSYEWNFGDGFTASGSQVSHNYNREGTFLVTLTVTDDDGAQDTDSLFVVVDSSENRGGDRDKREDVLSGHREIHDISLGNIRDLSGKSVFKPGDVVRLLIRFNNQGDFDEKGMQLQVYVPSLGVYSFVNNINLDVSQVKVVQADLVIPNNAKKGAHLAKLTLRNTRGDNKEAYWQFVVA